MKLRRLNRKQSRPPDQFRLLDHHRLSLLSLCI
jgi:hypothetical protein